MRVMTSQKRPIHPSTPLLVFRQAATDSTPSTDIEWRPHPRKSWITGPCSTRKPLRGQVSDRPGTVIQVRLRDGEVSEAPEPTPCPAYWNLEYFPCHEISRGRHDSPPWSWSLVLTTIWIIPIGISCILIYNSKQRPVDWRPRWPFIPFTVYLLAVSRR